MKKAGMLCALYLAVYLLSIHVQAQDQPSSKNTIAPPAITGTGTTNTVTKWTSASALGNSHITDTTSGNVGIGVTTPGAKLDVNGSARIRGASTFNETVTVSTGNLVLSTSGDTTSGVIYKGSSPFIHDCCPLSLENVFMGVLAGSFNANASSTNNGFGYNTGIGYSALLGIESGYSNTAVGAFSQSLGDGVLNASFGYASMYQNSSGQRNSAMGTYALYSNQQGSYNAALGYGALTDNTGSQNTGVGYLAGEFNTTANKNTYLGYAAGVNNATGSNNTFIGAGSGTAVSTPLSNSAAIGNASTVNVSNAMILGGTGSNAVTVAVGTASPYNDYALDLDTTNSNGLINGGVVVNANGGNLYLGMTNTTHKFRVDTNGVTYADGGFQSSGADFAESVEVRGKRSAYEPGDVLAIDQSAKRHLALSHHPYETLVAGIYSTKPGLLATPHNIDDPAVKTSEVPLAVVGIVPCKVTAENGAIRPGDLLVTSSRPGYAMKGTDRGRLVGAVVGKALEPLQAGTGSIQVLVTLQ